MVIRIMCQGGLGNQLFTLNAAHILSSTYGQRVEIAFDAQNRLIDRPAQITELIHRCGHNLTTSHTPVFFRLCDLSDRLQNHFTFSTRALDLKVNFLDSRNLEVALPILTKAPFLVRGYFQNANQVLETFSSYENEIFEYLHSIPKVPNIPNEYQAFHIRRGDYVINKDSLGELTSEYYMNTRDTTLPLVITTDYDGPKENLQRFYPDAQIVGPTDSDVWSSFKILSQARKLTIANSTYSWWAGLVASSLGSEVTRPLHWNKVQTLSSEYLHHPRFLELENSFA